MSEIWYTLITNIGKTKIANSIQLGTKINFAKLKVGDSNGKYYEPTESQVDLVNTKWEGPIRSVCIDQDNPNCILVDTMIPAEVGGFYIREAGIFDDDNNLIAISKLYETYKLILKDNGSGGMLLRIMLEVSNAANINLNTDPDGMYATKEDLKVLNAQIQNTNTLLTEKMQLYVSETLPPITDRKTNTLYFKVTDTLNLNTT